MSSNRELVLMDAGRIQRTLKRMAHEMVEKNSENRPLLLFGIDERGYAISLKLVNILQSIFDNEVNAVKLPIKHGSPEDVFDNFDRTEKGEKYIIVVDDVIFSGQTMFNALKRISENLDPPEIHSAVMVDRGHRNFPIRAEFYGMELPTKLNEHVSVVVENTNVKKVLLTNLEDE